MKTKTNKILIWVIVLVAFAVMAVGTFMIVDNINGSERVKVTLIVAEQFGDKSFYDSAKKGMEKLKNDKIADIRMIECKEQNFEVNLEKAAKGRDVVIMLGSNFTMVNQVATKYPETKFIWVDTDAQSSLDNVKSITYLQSEGAFLAGYIAAQMSTSKRIGMVGGVEGKLMKDYASGYIQGAKFAIPDIDIDVEFIGSFTDVDRAKGITQGFISMCVDVVFQVAGGAGKGVFEAVKEGNKYAIGIDSDQKYIDPDHIICSMIKNVEDTVYGTIKRFSEGEWEKGKVTYGLDSGYIGISYGDDNMPQQISYELKVQVDTLVENIKTGKITVDSTY